MDIHGLTLHVKTAALQGPITLSVAWGSSVHYGSARSQAQLAFNGSISVRSDRY